MDSPLVRDVRGRGLLIGASRRRIAERGVLTKDTYDSVIRFAPPLTIDPEHIHEGAAVFATTIDDVRPHDRKRPRDPITCFAESVPSSRHTANSPQRLKDGKA